MRWKRSKPKEEREPAGERAVDVVSALWPYLDIQSRSELAAERPAWMPALLAPRLGGAHEYRPEEPAAGLAEPDAPRAANA